MISLLAFITIFGILMAAAYKTFYNGYGTTAPVPENYDVVIFDDFTTKLFDENGNYKSLYFSQETSGNSSVGFNGMADLHVGTASLYSTGNAGAAEAWWFSSASFSWDSISSFDIQTLFRTWILPSGDCTIFFGIGQPSSDCAAFYFDPAVSENWICKLARTSQTLAQVVTDVPCNHEDDALLRITGGTGQTDFYINNELVASIPFGVIGRNGVTWNVSAPSPGSSAQIDCDAVSIRVALKNPRQFR